MIKAMLLLLVSFVSVNVKPRSGLTDMNAETYIVMETNSGRIIKEHNKDKVMLTASIAKIITTITAIENGNLEEYVVVDGQSVLAQGSKLYLEVGDELKLIDLLYGLMLRSGNDAAELIAKKISGDIPSFMKLVNDTAKKIGMTNSTFENPSGLDSDVNTYNYSTAYDMAKLVQYASKNETFNKISGAKSYDVRTKNDKFYRFYHKHKLVGGDYITGGKTGYTKMAHRTLVTTGGKDGVSLIVVTFNSGNDFNEHRNIIHSVLNSMTNSVLVEKKPLYEFRKYFGKVPVVYEEISYPLFNNEEEITYELVSRNSKPILKIYLNNKLILERELGFLND